MQASADYFVIIDDQSNRRDEDYDLLAREFGSHFVSTNKTKSIFNGINQLRAIRFGLEYIGVRDNEYYWVIDADDIPLEDAVTTIKQVAEEQPNAELIAFSRQENNGVGMETICPVKSHFFWLSNAPTSSLVVKGAVLNRVWNKLFNETRYYDVWFDIRISACVSNYHSMVSECVSHIKLNHNENDSARYMNDKIEIYKRIANSLAYYVLA